MRKQKRNLKERTFSLVEAVSKEDLKQRHFDYFDVFIMILICLNVMAVILESFEPLRLRYRFELRLFEVLSIIVFTIEYLLRLWSCTVDPKYSAPVIGRIRFMFSLYSLVDLMAILPFYLPMLLPVDLRFLRAFRLFRLLRVLKFGRYTDSMRLFGRVLRDKKSELYSSLIVIIILLIIASSLLYSVEREVQPDKFTNILSSMWWGVATFTTVGSGDIYPVTSIGRLFGAIISLLGVGFFALPTGILSAGFVEAIKNKSCLERKCPHCGRKLGLE